MNDQSLAPPLLRSTADGIATLQLNRPRQYNALSGALLHALHGELDALASDSSVRVVLVTGAGSAFCSGHDLKEMRGLASRGADYHGPGESPVEPGKLPPLPETLTPVWSKWRH